MACVLLPPLLVYLSLYVLQREIIFIDISMAQMASLGFCVGVLLHLPLEGPVTIAIALGFTLVGAALFLASEASSFVTGQSINLDGGVTGS